MVVETITFKMIIEYLKAIEPLLTCSPTVMQIPLFYFINHPILTLSLGANDGLIEEKIF